MVRHLEWRRDPVLGELGCGHRGVRVEPSRLPQRHTQLKAGRPPQEIATSLPQPQRARLQRILAASTFDRFQIGDSIG